MSLTDLEKKVDVFERLCALERNFNLLLERLADYDFQNHSYVAYLRKLKIGGAELMPCEFPYIVPEAEASE